MHRVTHFVRQAVGKAPGKILGKVKQRAAQWQRRFRPRLTRAQRLAIADLRQMEQLRGAGSRRFSQGRRPVIRWIKGDGLDDAITTSAIAQATRLFGSRVDYCLCSQGIDAARARSILSGADQPVEWWPVSEHDNPGLAARLLEAGCPPERFGYWWKWFPERVRPEGPEWILDGDMVITAAPPWFEDWASGVDGVRVAQDDKEGPHIYGAYANRVDPALQLYSGLVSLPPGCHYLPAMLNLLSEQPLQAGHNGQQHMCEQGVVVAALQTFRPQPIPLHQFPFARAFQDHLDFGLAGDQGDAWGYHFGNAFRRRNRHYERLVAEGVVFGKPEENTPEGDPIDRHLWLGGMGPWGIPGWTMTDAMARLILRHTARFAGHAVLELGTSRGRMTAMLAEQGCCVTTVDHVDRGAATNLQGLAVEVVVADAVRYLEGEERRFALILCDVHGNSPAEWARLAPLLMERQAPGGTLLASNAALHELPEWHEETGVRWFTDQLPAHWTVAFDRSAVPGLAIIGKPA